jgi:type IV secretion system protein VirB1
MNALPVLVALCAPAVHPSTALSLVQQESGGAPLAMGINGRGHARLSRPAATEAQAVWAAKALIAQGYSVDMGLAQINSQNLRRLGLTVEDVFKPCVNLRAMQTLLLANYARAVAVHGPGQLALQAALSAYNTGDARRGLRNGYVRAVYQQAVIAQAAR